MATVRRDTVMYWIQSGYRKFESYYYAPHVPIDRVYDHIMCVENFEHKIYSLTPPGVRSKRRLVNLLYVIIQGLKLDYVTDLNFLFLFINTTK